MVEYVKSLLPRLQQYSKSLNETAIFADVPWGFIDDDGDNITYIFRRNNELLVSKRGEVTTGHWEYLSVMQSLLIEHANRKRMYNQGFIDNVVMVLRKDGTEDLFLLANQKLLPDLNVSYYLGQKIKNPEIALPDTESKRITAELINPRRLITIEQASNSVSREAFRIGRKVYDGNTGNLLENGKFLTSTGFRIEVEDGVIVDFSMSESYLWYLIGFSILILGFLVAVLSGAFK